jgi:hypothetical protein
MMTCTRCGATMKAGIRSTVLVQKAVGLVALESADRDEVRPGDSYYCPACQEERERNP